MSMNQHSLSIAIRKVRGNRPQLEFAQLLGVTVRTVSRWEAGEAPVSLSNLRLLVAHGLPAAYLLSDVPASMPGGEAA